MEPHAPAILIVEDHLITRRFLADNLAADGYEPVEAETAADGLRLITTLAPDLAIIDLGLPDRDGLDLVSEVRKGARIPDRPGVDLPVLILSGRCGELDRVRGFERGCDDFMAKPFSYPELRARVGALLRRGQGRPRLGPVRVGVLEIDPVAQEVRVDGHPVALSRKEFALLQVLAIEPNRVFTREELLHDVWGFQSRGQTRTLDSHASRLRRKLTAHGHRFILNVWGVGYRLTDAPAPW
ncbi:MAG: response regulator transcription factor [Solirubrobacteraceae bacterium]